MLELLNTYYKNKKFKSRTNRQQVHQNGEWHETFQCIFMQDNDIFLQKRSSHVKDYKGMLDVTVGGHLLSKETVEDGVREIEEEMGIKVSFERLEFLCTIPQEMTSDYIIDKEFIHIYTLEVSRQEVDHIHHDTEVDALLKVNKQDFYNFCVNNVMTCKGYHVFTNEIITFTKNDFLPYSNSYFMCIGALLHSKK
ncbi:NUDIX domain-containing protein [Macrococcoides canis]|nr:NUDIX domain-containing protein [Macrococcus canis]QNR06739.1 NUDIX domain-containing protein [Macrococcus canis]